jgi:hypothetical protein
VYRAETEVRINGGGIEESSRFKKKRREKGKGKEVEKRTSMESEELTEFIHQLLMVENSCRSMRI